MTHRLYQQTSIGDLNLANRIVMAPMTRLRAHADGTASPVMAQYYSQRTSAGLIVSECTMVSAHSQGYMHAPGMYLDAHCEAWKTVTQAVHNQGGKIFLQLWHCGRISHSDLLDGKLPVAPSPIAAPGELHTPNGKRPLETPRELQAVEIPGLVAEFVAATKLARRADFDGVEIHGAFGYLIDQFLQSVSNKRKDHYGGSIANRCRFVTEIVEALCDFWPHRIGIKLSPSNTFYGMGSEDNFDTFRHLLTVLNDYPLAYVHMMEPTTADMLIENVIENTTSFARNIYRGKLISNGGHNQISAQKVVSRNFADAVSFGKSFIANPDLPRRLMHSLPLAEANPSLFYGSGPESTRGYTDYHPFEPASE